MKQLKDYLHYLGCDAIVNNNPLEVLRIVSVWLHPIDGCLVNLKIREGVTTWYEIHAVKLILRPLSDITRQERMEILDYENDYRFPKANVFTPKQFTYLLSKHFDLFNLIEAGLAIDATTLKEKTKIL